MGRNELDLVSISELLDKKFFIPAYQRGYRWQKQQVLDLLEDIKRFYEEDFNGFYSLQPLVVKREQDRYRVIDGQQRLTTIYIILSYLNKARKIIFNDTRLFELQYETRPQSQEFLENKLAEGSDENPDFYYMSQAYRTIKGWFEENKINIADFLNALLKHSKDERGKDKARNVRFIWYEVKEEDERMVFLRLNIGKIPLSNAELIKAMILLGLKEYQKMEVVSEWDLVERKLQEERFFSFLTTKAYKRDKIAFLFDLLAKQYKDESKFEFEEGERFSFYIFERILGQKGGLETWEEVKAIFRIFEELYNEEPSNKESYDEKLSNHNLYYHYVGFLTNSKKTNIGEIVKLFRSYKKSEFEEALKKKMKIKLSKDLEDLNYESDKKRIEEVLFLFNVVLAQKSGFIRYPFNLHKNEHWSLEHIHAQNSEGLDKKKKKEILEEEMRSQYINEDLKSKIKKQLEQNEIDDKAFEELQDDIFGNFGTLNDIHSIGNLTLLSKELNSSLSNSIFPEKQKKIKKWDKEGRFLPIGTKNAFMKYYNEKIDPFKWGEEDKNGYIQALKSELKDFIKVDK